MSFLRKAQQQLAHTTTLPSIGNQELRSLQGVISSEKYFIQANTKAANEFKKNAEALKVWAADEGDDLNDILGKVSVLFDHFTTSQNRLHSHLSTVRLHFKSIRTREEALSDLKSKKRSLGSNIEKIERKLSKMGPENKELMKVTQQLKDMRIEMENLRIEVMQEEAAIGDFKRRTVKESLSIKCGALQEMAEKVTIVAQVGKLILEQVPLDTTQPGMPRPEYYGHANTESLLQDATRSIADVGFSPYGASMGMSRTYTEFDSTDATAADQDHQYLESAVADPVDTGYTPSPPLPSEYQDPNQDLSKTPIYASHASPRSAWAQEAQTPNNDPNVDLIDQSTDAWRTTNNATVGGSAANGFNPDGIPPASYDNDNGDESNNNNNSSHDESKDRSPPAQTGGDGGFFMSSNNSVQASSHPADIQSYAADSNRNSADFPSSVHAPSRQQSVDPAASSDHLHNLQDAYDGYSSANAPLPPAPSDLGIPILPPLRSSTPFPPTNLEAPAASKNDPSSPSLSPVTTPSATTTTATAAASTADDDDDDDASYFQSVGATRAHQEAVRRPQSPNFPPTPGSRVSTYGSIGAVGGNNNNNGAIITEGKKVTAAAFRRGFHRNPSASALSYTSYPGSNPSAVSQDEMAGTSTPIPPGGYSTATPETEYPSATPPLHIQKRNSTVFAVGAALPSSPSPPSPAAQYSGRSYSIEQFAANGSDHPAPPYAVNVDHHHPVAAIPPIISTPSPSHTTYTDPYATTPPVSTSYSNQGGYALPLPPIPVSHPSPPIPASYSNHGGYAAPPPGYGN